MTALPRWLRHGAAVALLLVLPGCVSIPTQPRALAWRAGSDVAVEALACTKAPVPAAAHEDAHALDPDAIRILTWNIHKESDPGWQRDLAGFAADSDVLLLQEVVLDAPLRHTVEGAGLAWVMGSSFVYRGHDVGVMTGSRRPPARACTERAVEPLLRIPKSAVIEWFPLAGSSDTLAVVNVHAINFALTLDGYRAQLAALADTVAAHRGPIVFAGDLNTWTDARDAVMRDVAARLRLTEVKFREDRRSLFFGRELDHIYVRGLALVDAEAIPVASSDHNPVRATLRVAAQ